MHTIPTQTHHSRIGVLRRPTDQCPIIGTEPAAGSIRSTYFRPLPLFGKCLTLLVHPIIYCRVAIVTNCCPCSHQVSHLWKTEKDSASNPLVQRYRDFEETPAIKPTNPKRCAIAGCDKAVRFCCL